MGDDNGDGIIDADGGIPWVYEILDLDSDGKSTSLAVGQSGQIYSSYYNHLVSLDELGNETWRVTTDDIITRISTTDLNTIYVGTQRDPFTVNSTIQAFNQDGSVRWAYTDTTVNALGVTKDSSAIFASRGGNIGSISEDGRVNWFRTNVTEQWLFDFAISERNTAYIVGRVEGSGINGFADEKLYEFDTSGNVIQTIDLQRVNSSPVIGRDGQIFIVEGSTLVSYSATGEVNWKAGPMQSSRYGIAIDKNDNVYVQGHTTLYSFRPDGSFRFEYDISNVYLIRSNGSRFQFLTSTSSEVAHSSLMITEDGTIISSIGKYVIALSPHNLELEYRENGISHPVSLLSHHPIKWIVPGEAEGVYPAKLNNSGQVLFSTTNGKVFAVNSVHGPRQNSPWPMHGNSANNAFIAREHEKDFDGRRPYRRP